MISLGLGYAKVWLARGQLTNILDIDDAGARIAALVECENNLIALKKEASMGIET